MDIVGRRVEGQVQFWSFLGPFFVLLSISVLLFKVSPHWYFPVSALIGIPLCVKWKMKGMAAALCCLLLLSGMGYQNLELDDRYWHVGLALAMAFSFIVLTLSLEEVQAVVNKMELESQSRLDNFLFLDEKLKLAEQEWGVTTEKSVSASAALTQEVARIQEDKQTFYKLAQLAKDELVQVRNQHDQLMQDLLYKKQQIAQLQELLDVSEMTVQDFVNSDAERQVQALKECVAIAEREKDTLRAKITLIQSEGEACQREKKQLRQEIEACREREKLSLVEKLCFQEDKLKIQALQTKYDLLEQEKQTVLQAKTKLMQQVEQVRYVEAQQQQMIQQFQSKIFDIEVKLNIERQQKINSETSKQELEDKWIGQFTEEENKNKQHQEEYQQHLQQIRADLEEQKVIVKSIQSQNQEEQRALKQENIETRERYQEILKDLCRARAELEVKQNELVQVQQQVLDLLSKLKEQKTKNGSEKLPYAPGNHRQIDAMYIQLKEQFQEKCAILDNVRRELFQANEKSLKYKKEYEEEHVFDQLSDLKSMERHCLEFARKYEKDQQEYQEEIHELTQLIDHLLSQMASK